LSLPPLPYGDTLLPPPPEDQEFGLLDAPLEAAPLDEGGIDRALASPIASPPLEEVARGARRVHVVVPDATRAAGTRELLAATLAALGRAGVEPARVAVVFSLGLHRSPSAEERRRLLGEWEGRLEVVPCEPDRAEDRADLGRTSFGTPVWLGRRALAADRVILAGSIGFHYFAGFTGGRKAILPGLAASASIRANHLRVLGEGDSARDPRVRPGNLDDNPVHLDMQEAAAKVGPAFLVNSVTDDAGRVVAVFAGHWREAHRAGCEWFAERRALRAPQARRLVVASAGGYPKDINLIQAHKAMEHAQAAVADGGALVLAAECRDGIGHAGFLSWMARRSDLGAFRARLRDHYEVYGQTAYALAAKLERFRVVLISALPEREVEAAGMAPASSLVRALEMARLWTGDTPAWWVPHAGAVVIRKGCVA
jgi:nickel-dependent lactate racemase